MAFDVAGARQAGYSEDEIADYLAAESNFDAAAARQAGYSSAEILSHLTAKEPEPVQQGDPMGSGAAEMLAQPAASKKVQPEGTWDAPPTNVQPEGSWGAPVKKVPVQRRRDGRLGLMGVGPETDVNAEVPRDPGRTMGDELGQLRDELFVGVDQGIASVKGVNAAVEASRVQQLQDRLQRLEASGRGDSIAARKMRSELSAAGPALMDATAESARANADLQRGAAMVVRPEVRRLTEAKTLDEAWEAFKAAPYDVIAGVTAQSLPLTLPALLVAVAGGPAAGAVTMGLSSGAVEFGSSLSQFAQESGVDVTNALALEAFYRDPKALSEGLAYAGKRAGIVGAFDAASGGLAGKTLAPAMKNQLARQAVNLPAQMGAQAALGGAGEAGAQLATKGTIDAPGEVLAEMVGELGGAPAEVLSFSPDARAAVSPPGLLNAGEAPIPSAEQIAREKGFLVASATAPVAPRPTDTQALMDVMSAPTVDAAIDAAEAAIAEQPAAPTPGQQDVQQTVGLITELERLQAEEAAAPPGVAQTQPAPVASAPQDAAPAQGLLGATEAPPAQMPTKLWTGRRGDGYASDLDAASALTSRRQREPNLDWRIEPRGSRFVLAGYERQPAAETANASVPAEVPAVAAGADRGGLFDATPGVAAGVGNRDAAGPALDAGGVRDQAAGGAVPHGTGAPSSAVTGELQIEIEGQGPMRLSLFDTRQLPDDSAARTAPGPVITRTQGAHLEALGVALGKKVVFYRADRDRAPDGFVADNDTGTLYVNERSGITPVAVLGHEFFHTVKQTDPEIHATLEAVVAKRMQVGKVQREYVQRLGYAQGSVIEELTSDIGGDLLNDPTFLPEVFQEIERRHADKAPGMIRKIASIFNTIVTKAISAFRGRNDFGAQQMVDQLQEVRTAFRSGLADYLEKRGISPTTFEADMLDAGRAPGEMQAEDRSRFDKVAVQIEVTAGDGTKATLKIKDAGAAIREYDAREKALVALRMCAGR